MLVLVLFLSIAAVSFVGATLVTSLEDKVDVSAYFKTEATNEEIIAVKHELENLGNVKFVEYISRDQALEEFKTRHAGDTLIQESLAELDENPLQASLNIKAGDPSQYASIVGFLEANKFRPLVDKINFYENEQVIGRIQQVTNGIQNWGFIATIMLAVVAVLVTFNTIRLTIYNQKQEIEIMRLVGGSNWYIRGPFLVEGALYGVFAALFAVAVFYPLTSWVSPKMEALMPGVSVIGYFITNAAQFVGLSLGAGIVLGVISSLVAIRRFLKV